MKVEKHYKDGEKHEEDFIGSKAESEVSIIHEER